MKSQHPQLLEFLFGGVSTCSAALLTNPLEVVKTRMQLQGELCAKGQFQVHYRNVFHAFYTVAKHEGLCALQKGIGPALVYQFVMNGFRLGSFQLLVDSGIFKDKNGQTPLFGSILCGALAGTMGGFLGSPIYMVKTHMQSKANRHIAVGYQNECPGLIRSLRNIYSQYGITALWRGSSGAVARVIVGSATQLATFSQAKHYIVDSKVFTPDSFAVPVAASMLSGCVAVAFMTPFDVVSTRLYNQKVVDGTSKGGVYYSGFLDCIRKIYAREGLWGFYKGWAASLFRLGPHTVLSLVFWDQTRAFYLKWYHTPNNNLIVQHTPDFKACEFFAHLTETS